MPNHQKTNALYPHPFSRAYWTDAALELKDPKMLVFAAMMIAVRVAMKGLYIPLAPSLKINTAFLANAVGAMVFGPVVAGLSAIVSDVLGFLLHPDGIYFVPFLLTEVAGSVVFALFLYRAKVTPSRVILSRFVICLFVNVVLQTPLMIWYYAVCFGGKSYVLTVPGILKNLFMFPLESVALTLLLRVILPITNRMGLTYWGTEAKERLRFSKKQLISLALLMAVGTGAVLGYLGYHYQTTSLSASYTSQERLAKNISMLTAVRENSPELGNVVTVIESANKQFLGRETTYTVAVYGYGEDVTDDDLVTTLWWYSKSMAAKDDRLTRLMTVELILRDKDGSVASYRVQES